MRLVLIALSLCVAALPAFAAEKKPKPPWRLERVWDPQTRTSVPVSPEARMKTSGTVSLLGKATVTAGCNTIWVRGVLIGSAIRLGKPWSTEKACPEDIRAIEAGVIAAASMARIYERASRNLMILRAADGQEVLALSR